VIDKSFIDQVQKVLSRLTSVVSLLDEHGRSVMPDTSLDPLQIPHGLEKGRPHVLGNRTWIPTDIPPIAFIVVHGAEAASVDCALLAHALLQSIGASSANDDKNSAARSIIRGDIISPELEALAAEYKLPLDIEQAVMIFHVTQPVKNTAMELLAELIPVGEDDLLVEINRHTIAMIKSLAQIESMDELTQLGEAVEQTLLSETAVKVSIAIGEAKQSLSKIAESYQEAWRALEVGHTFKPNTNVFLYQRLALERFLMETPKEVGQKYHHLLFNRKTSKLFNDEILYTIEMFFDKDLNLSDTARQLYIHRNTLVYRLDKVQRQTGLDLRHFEDAIAFRILFLLGKGGRETVQPTY
jgi:carbohydrate diacid regulator